MSKAAISFRERTASVRQSCKWKEALELARRLALERTLSDPDTRARFAHSGSRQAPLEHSLQRLDVDWAVGPQRDICATRRRHREGLAPSRDLLTRRA